MASLRIHRQQVNARLLAIQLYRILIISFILTAPRPSTKTTNTGTTTRPRPQPIAGTPPPDPNEKCDAKIIQQTCTLFGLDLVSRTYTHSLITQS